MTPWIFGLPTLPDLLQAPMLAALPGPVFGFLIDSLQHRGKVTEETGLLILIVALGVAGGGLVAAIVRRPMAIGAEAEAADPTRRRLVQLAPLAVGGAALAVIATRLLPEWYQAVRPPEGATGEAPAITPTSSFYLVSKNFRDPIVVADGWKLRVGGLVERDLILGYEDLKSMPQAVEIVTLECVSNPVGGRLMSTGRFEGPRLTEILARATPQPTARHVAFRASDGYSESLPIEELRPEVLVALMLNGTPLPNEHGFPARIVVPGRYGMKGPKWLGAIELVESPTGGYWEDKGWGAAAIVKTTSRIDVPADGAMLRGTAIRVAGVAFAGTRRVSEVEWSDDGGATWRSADLDPAISPFSWRLWRAEWRPGRTGQYTLMVRATDESGIAQDDRATNSFPNGTSGLHAITVSIAS